MADTTTPTTPVIPAAQDLQINLEDAPKVEEITTPENKGPELNLDLDLHLSDAPKDDDRLKNEDQKNNQTTETPVVEVTPVETVVKTVVEPIIEPAIPEISTETPVNEEAPVIEQVPTEVQPEINIEPVSVENKEEEKINTEILPEVTPVESTIIEPTVNEEVIAPSTTIESESITAAAPVELQEDMKMIDELEGHPSAGGLAPEAVVAPQPTPVEAPKTFDLDAMLGTTQNEDLSVRKGVSSQLKSEENEGEVVVPTTVTSQPVEQKTEIPGMPTVTATAPVMAPAFTIPTTTTTVPVQAVMQTSIPQNKNKGVKVLLFTVMFIALGFTTFFILKTMYPLEFNNIFGGGQTQMHASEVLTGTEIPVEITGTELTGTIETSIDQLSGNTPIVDTGVQDNTTPGGDAFGALNDLGTPIENTSLPKDNLSRLTDYVTQGNNFLAQGKVLNNNTIIKYSLYVSKKATTFLEDIANGKEINNLSGYFAQFDQYIEQLKILVGEVPNPTDTTVTTPDVDVSPTDTENNGLFEEMTTTPEPTSTAQ